MDGDLDDPETCRTIRCARCDRALFTVRDTRSGLAPASVICPDCAPRPSAGA